MATATPQDRDTDTAGALVRPPILLLVALLLGFALDHLLPLPRQVPGTGPIHWISAAIAGCLILAGLGIFAAGLRTFAKAKTPVPGTRPTRALVTTGIYRWSRNPIYLAMILVCGGIGLVVRSPWILILPLPLAITLRYAVVAREEAYLERRFGGNYRDYKARVRRWL